MNFSVKVICYLLIALLIVTACGCASKKSTANESFAVDTGDFDMSQFDSSETAGNTSSENGESKPDNTQKTDNSSKNSEGNKTNTSSETTAGNSSYNFSDDEFTPMEIPSRKNAYKLSNTYKKMKNGESVKVVYFGGSVTNGYGASDESKYSWRALTTAYLKSVSSGTVTEINAAEGGTGSYFGAARFEYDVSSKKPDLVFIEFAINDVYSGISAELSKANLEYMINNLYSANPYADIVIVLVTNKANYGTAYSSYRAHRAVADHYGIPIVDLGGEAYNRLQGNYTGLFSNSDSVHPTDEGYKLYADIMKDALKELLVSAPAAQHKKPASMISKNGFVTLTNMQADSVNHSGWSIYSWRNSKGAAYHSLYPKCLNPNSTTATLNLSFTGNTLGFIGTVKEKCTLTFVVDGSRKKIFQGTANSSKIEHPLFEDLDNTTHTVTVKVDGNCDAEIAAFVVTKR